MSDDAPSAGQPGPTAMRRALARARDGKTLDPAEATVLLHAHGAALDDLLGYAARTRDAGLAAARRQGMARPRESNAAKAGVFVTLVAGMIMVSAVGNGIANPLHVLAVVLLFSPVWILALGGLLLLHSRMEDRGARRLPPGPPGAG